MEDAETSRYYFPQADGEDLSKGWFVDANGESSSEPCATAFVGDACSYQCATGYVAAGSGKSGGELRYEQRSGRQNANGVWKNATNQTLDAPSPASEHSFIGSLCVPNATAPKPEPEPEPEPELEPEPDGSWAADDGYWEDSLGTGSRSPENDSGGKPEVDWAVHRRLLISALEAAGLSSAAVEEEYSLLDGISDEAQGDEQLLAGDAKADMLAELAELAERIPGRALQEELARLRGMVCEDAAAC